jgi:dTDP-glucose 4,6-dehydratase
VIIVTGGAGFIGANFVHDWLALESEGLVVVDKLTYAGNLDSLSGYLRDPRFAFHRADVCDRSAIEALLERYRPRAVLHFAAESHVDRSIHGPGDFVRTNINGTFELLEAARAYWGRANGEERRSFRFLHVSTDEVYGSLGEVDAPFSETTPYAPNSPYAASKAASDHLVRSYFHTYQLPTLTTNCSNNYGPFQFPEKLIPLMLLSALESRPLPIYGDGQNIRDWLYVGDHCAAIREVLRTGRQGETYNIGGGSEERNIDVVRSLCSMLDELRPRKTGSFSEQISFVADRPGHDRRYAINASKIRQELGWAPAVSFKAGLRRTVEWYLSNTEWIERARSGAYRDWMDKQYGSNSSFP